MKQLDLEKAEQMTSAEIGSYLLEREKKFAREYIRCGIAEEAAAAAGYSKKSARSQGSRILRKPEVKAYRMALIREMYSDKDLCRDSILLKYQEVVDRCMQKEPVMEWDGEKREWVESGQWKFDASGAIKALDGISRIIGIDSPKQLEVKSSGIEELAKLFGNQREL